MNADIPEIVNPEDIQPIRTEECLKKILIVKPSSLGDIFHAFPAFYLLKKYFPDSKIDWLINNEFSPVLDYLKDDINRVILFRRGDFKNWLKAVITFFKLIIDIRRSKYDLTIDMQGLMRSSLMTFISRSKRKVGFADVRESISKLLYNVKVDIPEELEHAIEKNAYLVSSLFKENNIIPDYVLPLNKDVQIMDILSKKKIYSGDQFITIAPGARWVTKKWSPDFFAQVADRINKENPHIKILLIGSRAEYDVAEMLISKCKIARPISIAGETDLCELVEVIRNSLLILTNDSGPMHIAASLRKPVFALFGPTCPEKTGPYWPWHSIYQADNGCVKCLKRECVARTLECQKNISADVVSDDINKKIKELY